MQFDNAVQIVVPDIGQKVRFDPFRDFIGYGVQEIRREVTGTVFTVNAAHGWFGVAYEPGLRIGFRADDLGRTVKVV